ncbi:hypothetical protein K435DRAFT_695264, partial [Dendrothele bispora CBS 962.96]
KLIKDLSRKQTSLLVQLRTGHIPLHDYLHRFQKVDLPTCPCCNMANETVFHFLFQCTAHRRARDRLRSQVGRRNMATKYLFTSRSLLNPLFEFINASRRLHHIFGTIPPVPRNDDDDDE